MQTSDLGLLILRLAVGLTFAAHGAQKVLGWWEGPGPAGWRAAMERMGYRPPTFWAWVSGLAELGGGLLLGVGLLTPIAAALLVAQAVVIIGKVHLPKGFWNKNSGIEFPMALGAGSAAVLLIGPGGIAVDAPLGLAPSPTILLVLLVLGIVAGLVAMVLPSVAAGSPASATGR